MDPALSARVTISRPLLQGELSLQIVRICLDLAKYVFEIHGVDCRGKTILRKTLRRHAVSAFFANLPPCLVGMEASNGERKALLGLMAGSKEGVETVRAVFQDLRARGLGDPLLVVSDGAAGIIRAIEECFPRSARQRCLAHRMRNLAAKVPTDLWPDFKARVTACYQAPSRAIARHLAGGVCAEYADNLPSALSCFEDDFEACIAHLRLP